MAAKGYANPVYYYLTCVFYLSMQEGRFAVGATLIPRHSGFEQHRFHIDNESILTLNDKILFSKYPIFNTQLGMKL